METVQNNSENQTIEQLNQEESVAQFTTSKKNKGPKKTKDDLRREKQMARTAKLVEQSKKGIPLIYVKHDRQINGVYNNDLIIEKINVTYGGKNLLEDTPLKLSEGRKYGLVGRNGIGKTCFMNALARGQFEQVPKHLQILLVEQQLSQTQRSILNTVLQTDVERQDLLKEELKISNDPSEAYRLQQIYKRLEQIDAHTAQSRARKILGGLGFKNQKLDDPMSSLSGGWRVRVALARALFVQPDILLLDEPTNHLDLDAVMWLQDFIENCDSTVVIVSHDRAFLNTVTTDTIHFFEKKLIYYKGDYDTFEKTRAEANLNQTKQYQKQQDQIIKSQTFIDKFRANAKRASMVQSKIKLLAKVQRVEAVVQDSCIHFHFPNPGRLNQQCLKLQDGQFSYDGKNTILKDINFAVDQDSRISIVGSNGAGKSTLLKLLIGKLQLTSGQQYRNSKLKVSMFTQHHIDQLELQLTPLQQLSKIFPNFPQQNYRAHLSSFGIINKMALQPIFSLSGGQKSRVAFAISAWTEPHIMILDEPTNHLDLDAVNALIQALNNYQGGVIVVSHDQHLISNVCQDIWYIKEGRLKKFKGDFTKYRQSLLAGKL